VDHPVTLAQLLYSQGFGTRRECAALIAAGEVTLGGGAVRDPLFEVEPKGLTFSVRGEPWPYHASALLVMNKPAGVECSQQPRHHPSVYSLLPAPLRGRGVQTIGRLDADTTGLLLFTDDGALLHRLTSPKRHVAKVYEVGCKHPVDTELAARLLEGVMLHDEKQPVRAAACDITGPCTLRITLTEGKYHQVKRMVAAAGNRVESLHRSAFGALVLPPDLAPGAWRWLDGPDTIAPR
jgi:16S rRNA pseudouridine516 synthase